MQVIIFHVRADRTSRIIEIDVGSNPYFFAFERSNEPFTDWIVRWCSGAAKALLRTILQQQILISRADVLTSAIGVMDERCKGTSRYKCHLQCVNCQFGGDVHPDRPADAAAAESIEYYCQVGPPAANRYERYVSKPQLIGCAWGELGQVRKICARSSRCAPLRPAQRFAQQPVHAHQAQNALVVDHHALTTQSIRHLPIPIPGLCCQHVFDGGDEPHIVRAGLFPEGPVQGGSRQAKGA